MTGTVSEFIGEYENSSYDTNTFNLLASWLFGKINANCILQEIDQSGCMILIPVSQTIPLDDFKLIVMSPAEPEKIHTIVNARVMDGTENLTSRFNRVRVNFVAPDDDIRVEIKRLRATRTHHPLNDIRCSLLIA